MLPTSQVKSVDALRRGLLVLRVIRQSSALTLTELHLHTGIPKATLLRLLKTLQESGWIDRNSIDRRYIPAAAPGLTIELADWHTRLTSLAAPIRENLQRRIPWPTDLAVRERTSMLILDTQRAISGLAVNYRALGFRPAMLVSSLGRCYLAFCTPQERLDLLAQLAKSTKESSRINYRRDAVERFVSEGQLRGYCARDPSELDSDSPERFGAISVPVFAGHQLIACLSCSWLPSVTNEAAIVETCLPAMREAAKLIGERVNGSR